MMSAQRWLHTAGGPFEQSCPAQQMLLIFSNSVETVASSHSSVGGASRGHAGSSPSEQVQQSHEHAAW
jgi:hypothetical protein